MFFHVTIHPINFENGQCNAAIGPNDFENSKKTLAAVS